MKPLKLSFAVVSVLIPLLNNTDSSKTVVSAGRIKLFKAADDKGSGSVPPPMVKIAYSYCPFSLVKLSCSLALLPPIKPVVTSYPR